MGRYKLAALFLCFALLPACRAGQPADSGETVEEREQAAYSSGYAAGYGDGYQEGLEAQPEPGGSGPDREPPEPAEVPPELDSSGFVMVSDAVPDAILEIRYYSTYNFVGSRIDGYEEPVALLTKEAAAALRDVSDELSEQGYRLKIYDAYRPQRAVEHFKRWAADLEDIRMKGAFYPDLSKSVLFSQGYIASRSGHSRGSTVDLTLFDVDAGKELDMGGTFDYFGKRSHSGYTEGLTAEQIANRTLLRETMLAHGFKGISTEWWHFTLKNEPCPDTYFNFPVAVLS